MSSGFSVAAGFEPGDLRVMRGFEGVSYLSFCRDFLVLGEAESG